MSSDGSSGITQFGLYRTIDARTEEFLRLSRKRQIRQGCACAAVSTAITVTVVVSVLLVYEYSVVSGSSKNKSYVIKPNWLGFINDSADPIPFDAKYSKAKLNLDKTTIKLLPVLLKALKQNIFLDKVIEDYTSANPTYEPTETTEQSYEKNIFSDPRNWFKAPTHRVYAIEFKTSPIVYYQPTKNLEYMSKIRKIRDYKRILNYFEKMINDKVTFGSNLAMTKRDLQTEKPSQKRTQPIRKQHKSKEKYRINNSDNNLVDKLPIIESKNCKCPIKLGELLSKLMGNINQLLPYSKTTLSTLCNVKKSAKVPSSTSKVPSKATTQNYLTTKFTTLKPVNVITTPNYMENVRTTTEDVQLILQDEIRTGIIESDARTSKINFPLEKNNNKHEKIKLDSTINNINNYENPTTLRNYLEATEFKNIIPPTTKPMTPTTDKFENFIYQSFQNKFVPPTTTVTTKAINNKPIFSNEEYDDYFISTQRTGSYNDADVHNLELIKTRIFSPNFQNSKKLKSKNEVVTRTPIKTANIITDPNFLPLHKYKNKDVSFENTISSIFLQNQIDKEPKVEVQKGTTKAPKIKKLTEVYKFDHAVNSDNQFGFDDKILDDEFFEEYKVKQASKTAEIDTIIHTDSTPKQTDIVRHEKIKEYTRNKEKLLNKANSMLPRARPVYLEIQRNDWKQDDNHDYDFNVNNNLYDFPNI